MNSKPSVRREASEFDLEQFLPYRLSLLTNTISDGIARGYRHRHEIRVTEWRILAVLGRYPGLTASEVGERTAMDKVAISRAVKTLMGKGLLQRRTDESDRRRRRLFLTPGRGQSVLDEIIPRAQQYELLLLNILEKQERKSLSRILAKLQAQATKLNGA
jgi:DNA-binding MarR family transcriptional regulator